MRKQPRAGRGFIDTLTDREREIIQLARTSAVVAEGATWRFSAGIASSHTTAL
jgi:hypothetical protein